MKHPLLIQKAEEKNDSFILAGEVFCEIVPKRGRKEEVGNRSSTELGIWQTVSRTSLLELCFFLEEGEAILK